MSNMIPSTPPSSAAAAAASSSSDALAAAFEVGDDDALDDAVEREREVRRSNDDDDDGEDFRASTLPTAVIVLRLLPPRNPSTVAIAALINAAPRATLPKAMMRIVRRDDQCVHVACAHGGSFEVERDDTRRSR
jgi:hypothetical protein